VPWWINGATGPSRRGAGPAAAGEGFPRRCGDFLAVIAYLQ
jgi:hypothetical protein